MAFEKNSLRIHSAIENAAAILIISHERPDGDSFGAALCLAHYLDTINKPHAHFAPTPAAPYFRFLPKAHKLVCDYSRIRLEDYDVIITMDCGSLTQTNIHDNLMRVRDGDNGKCLINIDHHASNALFGNHNLVDTSASSTSEIVYRFLESKKIHLTKDMATCLLCGLITDTSNFTNGATTPESLRIASELLIKGARLDEITRNVIQNKNVGALQLWGAVLSRLEIDPEYGIAYTVITKKDIERYGASADAVDGITNFLNVLDRVNAVMVLREEDGGIIKGSLRTTKENVDVNALAQRLGGGGHTKAAGFKVRGRLEYKENQWHIV